MIRRLAFVTVLVLAAAAGACEKKSASSATGLPPTRAAVVGQFDDNPLLAFVPSDTPYAFATFKPVPMDVIHKMFGMAKPAWRRLLTTISQHPGAAERQDVIKDLIDGLETFDVKRFEELGFSAKARFAVYGMGAFPVFRVELSDGARVSELIKTTAVRWKLTVPAPTERADRRYWIVDLEPFALLVAIAPKEAVVAFAPRAVIDGNLAALVGEQPVANHVTTAQFRAIAERDGFTGQGVGYADVARVAALIANTSGAAPECQAAIGAIAQRVPRVAIGYDDFTPQRMAFGTVFELAPDLIADARGLSGSLVGLDRVLGQRPAMAFAVAINVEHGRTLLGRIAGAVLELGQRCQLANVVEGATSFAAAVARPLPPFLAGVHGGYAVLTNLKMGARGRPESIEGFGSLQLDHADQVLKLAALQMPNFDVPTDGKAHALPAVIPFPGHAAASESMIGFGLGSNSATAAVAGLEGKSGPSPLALIEYDYSRFAEIMLGNAKGSDADTMRDIFKAFGLAQIQLLVDGRGAVAWMSLEMR